jgi:hypothetical protein
MKMVEEAQRGDGPRQWRCSEECRVTPTCPASRERIGGEEGRGQSRVEGLGAALTGGGSQRCDLDEIRHGARVPTPGNWLNELSGVQGCAWFFGGMLKLEEWGAEKEGATVATDAL